MQSKFSCCLIGSGSLLIQCGTQLLDAGHTIVAIASTHKDVLEWAATNQIPSCSDELTEYRPFLKQFQFEYLFSIVHLNIIPEDILGLATQMAINFHDGPLPAYAGINAPSWAIINGEDNHGISWHQMLASVDEGDLLYQEIIPIDNDETAFTLNWKCYQAAVEGFASVIEQITGTLAPKKQDLKKRSYFAKYQRPDYLSCINWNSPADVIARFIRAMDFGGYENNFAKAKIYTNNKFYIIDNFSISTKKSIHQPGILSSISGNGIDIATLDLDINLKKISSLSGEPIEWSEFTQGITVGQQFLLPSQLPQENYIASAKSEAYWVKQFSLLKPHITQTTKAIAKPIQLDWQCSAELLPHITANPSLAIALFSAFITSRLQQEQYVLGVQVTGKNNYYLPTVPLIWNDENNLTSINFLQKIQKKIDLLQKHKFCALDIFSRYPKIAPHSTFASDSQYSFQYLQTSNDFSHTETLPENSLALGFNSDVWSLFAGANIDQDLIENFQQEFNHFSLSLLTTSHDSILVKADMPTKNVTLLDQLNNTASKYPALSICEIFHQQALVTPENIAVINDGIQLTYAQLSKEVDGLASYLLSKGVQPGDRIGVLLNRSVDLLVALLGTMRAQATYVPLDPIYPDDRLQHMIDDSGLTFLITHHSIVNGVNEQNIQRVYLEEIRKDQTLFNKNLNSSFPELTHSAYIIYTSGSTGKPKGVEVSHRGLTNFLISMAREPGIKATDRLLSVTTVCFDIAALELYLPLLAGASVEIVSAEMAKDGFALFEKMESAKTTIMQATPTTWEMLLAAGWNEKCGLKALCGGEPLRKELAVRLLEVTDQLWNMYGPTETTIWSSVKLIRSPDGITVGKPIANTTMFVLDEKLNPVAPGEKGELYIGGDGLAKGYWRRPELTLERFIEHPLAKGVESRLYKTGDAAKYNNDMEIVCLGRMDNQVKINGYRIELGEIEAAIETISEIEKAVLVVLDAEGYKELHAFLLYKNNATALDNHELNSRLANGLPSYMLPSAFHRVTAFPLTLNGKVDRNKILENFIKGMPKNSTVDTKPISTNDHPSPAVVAETAAQTENIDGLRELLTRDLIQLVKTLLKIDEVEIGLPFGNYGFNSLRFTKMSAALKSLYKIKISPPTYYGHDSIVNFVSYLIQSVHVPVLLQHYQTELAAIPNDTNTSIAASDESMQPVNDARKTDKSSVAIVGMSLQMPQAANTQEFWSNLIAGRDCITEIPESRWNWRNTDYAAGEANPYKWGGFIPNIKAFDAQLFNISPREASLMDPQQRLFLQASYSAIEDAGYAPASLSGTDTGVFVGIVTSDYWDLLQRHNIAPDGYTISGNINCVIANRVSYHFNLKGASAVIDTACSSSLVALHRAVKSIQSGECEGALVGGVNVIASPYIHHSFSKNGMLNKEGRCKSFDQDANGYVRSEGVVCLYLKPLAAAQRDNDHIYGVILGSAENHGGRTNSLSAPSGEAQAELIIKAVNDADIDVNTIAYIEAHGSGTPLGDPIEIDGIKRAFKTLQSKAKVDAQECAIASVKSNIGHLEAAAGLAGVAKVLLALKNDRLPGMPLFNVQNPHIDISDTPFSFIGKSRQWPTLVDNNGSAIPRRAGVSSFGFGGVNAHVIIEDIYQPPINKKLSDSNVFILSALNEERLHEYALQFDEFLSANEQLDWNSLCYTLQVGRHVFPYRLAIQANSIAECSEKLKQYCANKQTHISGVTTGNTKQGNTPYKELFSEKDASDIVNSLIDKKAVASLAKLWILGAPVNWAPLYANGDVRRQSLPVYPFAKTEHWAISNTNQLSSIEPALHPLIDKHSAITDGFRFTKEFSHNQPLIDDHVVNGKVIFPAVGYLELARLAGDITNPAQSVVKLKGNVWFNALEVNYQQQNLAIEVRKQNGHYEYNISSSQNNKKLMHAQGYIEYGTRNPSDEVLPISSIEQRCTRQMDHDAVYELFAQLKFEYLDGYKPIQHIAFNSKEAIAEIQLPEKFHSHLEQFVLHPSLLEGGIQTVIGILANPEQDGKTPYLPFSLKELEILAPLAKRCKVHINIVSDAQAARRGVRTFDITIADTSGKKLVIIKGYTLKNLQPIDNPSDNDRNTNNNAVLLTGNWSSVAPATATSDNIPVLVFENRSRELSDALIRINPQQKVISIIKGNHFRLDDEYQCTINPDDIQDYQNLFAYLAKFKLNQCAIIHAWSFTENSEDYAIHKSIINNFFSFSSVLVKQKPFNLSTVLYLFNNDSKFAHIHAGVSGFAKSVHQETNKVKISSVGLDKKPIELINQLASDISATSLPIELRYLDGVRQAKTYNHSVIDLEQKAQSPYQENSVYLITGGAGGLGLKIARHIGTKSNSHLIICGRSDAAEKLQSELSGIKYSYLKADISDANQAEILINGIIEAHGKLDGIFHCAGGLNDELLINKNLATLPKVLAPKTDGSLYLDEASKRADIKFFVLFSSVTAVMGNMGQTDYGYANSVLDGFAETRNQLVRDKQRSGTTISINWPLWLDGGMSANEQAINYFMQTTGVQPLNSQTGLDIIDYAISHLTGPVFIAKGDLEKISRVTNQRAHYQIAVAHDKHVKPAPDQNSVAKSLENDLFALAGNILGTQVSSFDKNAEFSTFGFDSISNTEFATAINQKLQTELTPVVFFEYNNFGELIEHLLNDHKDIINHFYSAQPAGAPVITHDNAPINNVASSVLNPIQVTELLVSELRSIAASIIKAPVNSIDPSAPLSGYGFDSISNTEFTNAINNTFGTDVTPVLFFEYETLKDICDHLTQEYGNKIESYYQVSAAVSGSINNGVNKNIDIIDSSVWQEAPHRESETSIKPTSTSFAAPKRFEISHNKNNADIAIIGMQGLLPQAESLADFWQLLLAGRDLVDEIPASRWSWQEYFGDAREQPGKTTAKWGSFIQDIDKFDAEFFNISADDARLMDPQQRLFIQLVWQTIEDAGYKPSDLSGTNTGLYVGLSNRDYFDYLQKQHITPGPEFSFGNNHAFLVNRISYLFNFNGPSEPIDTLCSSSLVAIHRAIQDLRAGLCEQAIVGGISLLISPLLSTVFEQAGMLSPEGRCRTFDADANGFVRGEGAGAILLKPLDQAIQDGDNVIAVIKASAVNHGGRANSLTAPNLNAQADLLIQAWSNASIDPHTISYIETHGTGTKLGDAIEINAIKKAFKTLKQSDSLVPSANCGLGSIKTNIGHLESASGIASVLKVLLALRYQQLPGLVHLKQVNPYIDLKNSPLQLVDQNQGWPKLQNTQGKPLPHRAGINAFGAGGVNAHLVVEEYQPEVVPDNQNQQAIIIVSAKDKLDLTASATKLLHHLSQTRHISLERVAYTLQVGRESFAHRLAIIADSISGVSSALKSFINDDTHNSHFLYADINAENTEEIDNSVITQALSHRDLQALAQYWLAGATPDWHQLYQGKTITRVSLPGYSFKKTRHWVDASINTKIEPIFSHQQSPAPTPMSRASSDIIYHQDFMYGESYLRDHKVFDDEVLLGVTYASMAIEATHKQQFNRIQRLLFINPLALYTGEGARVSIHKNAANEFRATYTVSDNPEHKVAATGLLASVINEKKFIAPHIKSLQFKKSLSQQQVYATLRAQGVDYSNSLLGVKQLLVDSNIALGKVEVNQQLLDSTPNYYLHPIWLDAAVVCAKAAFLDNTSSTYIPFSFNDIVIHEPPSHSSFCYVQLVKVNEQIFMCNAQLCDAQGAVQIDIQGMVCKRIRLEEEMQFTSAKQEPASLGS